MTEEMQVNFETEFQGMRIIVHNYFIKGGLKHIDIFKGEQCIYSFHDFVDASEALRAARIYIKGYCDGYEKAYKHGIESY